MKPARRPPKPWSDSACSDLARPGEQPIPPERTAQALIFTFIVQVLVLPFHWLLGTPGNTVVRHSWGSTSAGFISLILAILLGVILAYFTNNDSFHKFLRKMGLTTRTSHPSEWYTVFSEKVTYIVLNLKDGRRLYGWPSEWPIEPGKGQFYITSPLWIIDKENETNRIELSQLVDILLNAEDVQWVEFARDTGERDG